MYNYIINNLIELPWLLILISHSLLMLQLLLALATDVCTSMFVDIGGVLPWLRVVNMGMCFHGCSNDVYTGDH